MTIPVASVVTKKTICEFDLLKLSLEQYHNCQWAISCDDTAYAKYKEVPNIECLRLIETDDCDHNVGTQLQKDNFMKVMMTKLDAAEHLISNFGHALFLDSDMIFVNPIEDKILEIFNNIHIDACICQHMTNDWQTEARHGLYNGGMYHVRSQEFVDRWRYLCDNYKEYGFYYDQQSLEFVQRNFVSLNLPINYNIGWWRFNNPNTRGRLDLLNVRDNKIFFGDKPAVNFHVHTLRELGYQNFGQFLVDKIKTLLCNSNNENYKTLLGALGGI